MRRLLKNRSGATAMEFGLIAVPMCLMMFAIFDLGRYAVVLHSLSDLAEEGARRQIICYSPYVAANTVAQADANGICPSDPVGNKLALAPFLTGLSPALTTQITAATATVNGRHVVTATVTGYSMILKGIWPSAMNNPSTSSILPF